MSGVHQKPEQAPHPYAYPFRKANHRLVYFLDEFTGELGYEILPCDSATCSRSVCRERGITKRIQALRYVLRNRNARLLTLTKFENVETADLFADLLKKHLRRAGHTAELYMAVEPHSRGLLHAHLYLVSDASDAQITELFHTHIESELDLTAWSNFHISDLPSAQNAGYLLKEAKISIGRHLNLNGGRLHRKNTHGFFRWAGVRSIAKCVKAERRRARAFRAVEWAVGSARAEKLTSSIPEAHIVGALAALLLRRAMLAKRLGHLSLTSGIEPASSVLMVDVLKRVLRYPLKIP